MLNDTIVPIYNVFKIGRESFMQGAKPCSVWSWTDMINSCQWCLYNKSVN